MRVAAAVADSTQRRHITMVADRFAATRRLPMVEGRVPANPKQQRHTQTAAVDRMRLPRITAAEAAADSKAVVAVNTRAAAVVDMPAVVVDSKVAVVVADMKAADTGNR
jgi:microcystin-dependent protein